MTLQARDHLAGLPTTFYESITMNIKQLIATAAILAVTAPVFAGNVNYAVADKDFVSTKTRAEVVAELKVAQANGTIFHGDAYPQLPVVATSTRSRAEVLAELKVAQANGTIFHGDFYPPLPVTMTSTRTRAEVRLEAAEAARTNRNVSDTYFGN